MTKQKTLTYTVSYNNKRWSKSGTVYRETLTIPKELKQPLINYLNEKVKKLNPNSDYYEVFYLNRFIDKLENKKIESGGWYAPSLIPAKYTQCFLWEEEKAGRITGKRSLSGCYNTAIIFK